MKCFGLILAFITLFILTMLDVKVGVLGAVLLGIIGGIIDVVRSHER